MPLKTEQRTTTKLLEIIKKDNIMKNQRKGLEDKLEETCKKIEQKVKDMKNER